MCAASVRPDTPRQRAGSHLLGYSLLRMDHRVLLARKQVRLTDWDRYPEGQRPRSRASLRQKGPSCIRKIESMIHRLQHGHRPRNQAAVAILFLALIAAILAAAGPARAEPGDFSATGNMGVARYLQTQSTLPNGKVLVTGGTGACSGFCFPPVFATAELYDPQSGTFAATGSMSKTRSDHTATVLTDGRVLVAGGYQTFPLGLTDTADIYDPQTGTFTATGSMTQARRSHTATLLADGRVLIAGGRNNSNESLDTAEIFDPETSTFSATANMSTPRADFAASRLSSGAVLLVGGALTGAVPQATAELYDAGAGTFSATGSMSTPRRLHTASVLQDGTVLVVGGDDSDLLPSPVASAERYVPSSGAFASTGSLAAPRSSQSASVLPTGHVLVAGGTNDIGTVATAEIYTPSGESFSATGSMAAARQGLGMSVLDSGKVLVTGGRDDTALDSAELYDTPLPSFAVSPASVSFGDQAVSSSSAARATATAAKDVVVTNSGSADLAISAVNVTGTDAAVFSAAGDCSSVSLQPQDSCTVTVTFRPTTVGKKSAALRFTNNARNSPQTVALSGAGVPAPTPSGTQLDVTARSKAKKLSVGKKTKIVRDISSNGKLKKLKVNCYFQGQKMSGEQKRSVCRIWLNAGKGVVKARPECSTKMRIQVRIVAKATGEPKATWKRKWRVKRTPRTVCSLNGNG